MRFSFTNKKVVPENSVIEALFLEKQKQFTEKDSSVLYLDIQLLIMFPAGKSIFHFSKKKLFYSLPRN